MGMLDHTFNTSCDILATTVNQYGDMVEVSRKTWKCRINDHTQIQHGSNKEEEVGQGAILWISPDAPIIEGTLLYSEGKYWRVKQITTATRFRNNDVLFLKCGLERHQGTVLEVDNGS